MNGEIAKTGSIKERIRQNGTHPVDGAFRTRKRSNEAWVAELRGECGGNSQQIAYEDLANYLFSVAQNYLYQRASTSPFLAGFDGAEIADIAQDYVQEVLERLAANDHKRLTQYRGAGNFTSWAAVVLHRQIASDLRKFEYAKRAAGPTDQILGERPDPSSDVQFDALLGQVREALQHCMDRLEERMREVFYHRLVEELPSKEVAELLDTTVQAVNSLLCRAKPKLRSCLLSAGIDEEILTIFDGTSVSNGVVIQPTDVCTSC